MSLALGKFDGLREVARKICPALPLRHPPRSAPFQLNEYASYDQFAPAITAAGSGSLILWTSSGQEEWTQSVFGRFLDETGAPAGSEFRVNERSSLQRVHPAVTRSADGVIIGVWSGYVKGSSFDIFMKKIR